MDTYREDKFAPRRVAGSHAEGDGRGQGLSREGIRPIYPLLLTRHHPRRPAGSACFDWSARMVITR